MFIVKFIFKSIFLVITVKQFKVHSVKHEISCSALNWTSVEYPETIWNLNSYSHNAELNNFMSSKLLIIN